MKLISDLIIFVLKILIAIGDIVLLFFNFVISVPGKIGTFFISVKKRLSRPKKLKGTFKISKTRKSIFRVNAPSVVYPKISLPKFNISKAFRLKPKKRKNIKVFPIPFLFKLRYFLFGSIFTFVFVFMPVLSYIFIQSLPSPYELSTQDIAQTTRIYDRNGKLLFQIFANQDRTLVPLSDIPKTLKEATIATEDKNFYTSPGVDIVAIFRSAASDLQGRPLQGGSTITQQLIKSRLLSPERSISRKLKEIVLAVWAEKIYTKDQILEMYFNQVPYGGTAWGAQAASQTYFGKNVKDLTLAESAFLAGLPQAPTTYSPYGQNPNLWKSRQKDVLDLMRQQGYINKNEETKALSENLTFLPPKQILHAPHFVMYVKNFLIQKYGLTLVERGGLNVTTTLDLNTQDEAQKIIKDRVDSEGYLGFTNSGALITNPKDGDILAMVGGKDYYAQDSGNFNVTTALRQPGSTIKVITYSAALMNGFTAATPIADSPVSFGSAGFVYSPVNYDGKFHGVVTLRQALANSINVPAVKTLDRVGIPTMVNLAKKMGITTWGSADQYGLSITLGAAETKMTDMATVYGTLANEGQRVDLNPVLKITDYKGNVYEEKKDVKPERVMPEGVAYIISSILSDNNARSMEFGFNSPLNIPGRTVSVKTGTTDNKRDNWTIGYTPNFLVAVWVGNNNNAPMNPILASGITGAAPIWNKLMTMLLKGSDPKLDIASVPDSVVQKSCFGKNELFIKGTENFLSCSRGLQSPSINANISR